MLLGSGGFAAGGDPSAPRTPQEALGALKAGSDRFARNTSSPVSPSVNRRRELADAQHPMVIRTAGEVIDRSILATVE